jgi:predicted nucleotidyltransferase
MKQADMGIRELLKAKRKEILRVATECGARNVRIFGSIVNGTADEHSDVDFLVEMEPGRSILDMGNLLVDLENLLHRSVDIVTERGLKKRIRERIVAEAVPL